MWTRQHRERRIGRLVLPILTTLFLAYFGYHAYHGAFGIYSRYELRDRATELEAQIDELHTQRVQLEQQVMLMHDGTLERDMLDEQARRALNFAQPDEVTILIPAQNN